MLNVSKWLVAFLAICLPCIHALSAETCSMALVNVSVACVREQPRHAAELGSQVVMGTPLKLVDKTGNWYAVETPEGYHGYVIDNSLLPLSNRQYDNWRRANRVVVDCFDQSYIYTSPHVSPGNRLTDVVNGSILEADSCNLLADGFTHVLLPDGRQGYINSSEVMPIKRWAQRECAIDMVINFAKSMMGAPYLWGGTSSKSADCSGLTKIAYLSQGVILPRNASQQAKIGRCIPNNHPEEFLPGDLLLFGEDNTGKINHVGIYIGNSKFIHSSGRVKINSLSPSDPNFLPLSLLRVRRLDSTHLRNLSMLTHPWFF